MTAADLAHAAERDDATARAAARRTWLAATAVLFLAFLLVLLVGRAMRRGLNHDEHQFIASGALIARAGLLPYRDFPYFHTPALSYVYALLFQFSGYLLQTARLFNVLCSWLMCALLLFVALDWLRNLRPWARLATGALTVLLLVSSIRFLHASGRAWNHDLATLLAVAAAVVQVYWLKRGSEHPAPGWWLFGAGLLIGLAASVRSSFAIAMPAFGLAIFLRAPLRSRRGWAAAGWLAGGALLGLAPLLAMFAAAPSQFIFGNLTYAQLNTQYYRLYGTPESAMSVAQKLARTAEYMLFTPGNALMVAVPAVALWHVRRSLRPSRAPELLFLLLLLPFLLGGAYAASPIQPQYVYPLYPFLALLFLAALAHDSPPRWGLPALAVATAVAAAFAMPRFVEGFAVVFTPAEWYPRKVHAHGELLGALTRRGRILTLAPIYALEGRAEILPELVTGPMGWRVAPLLNPEQRRAQGLIGLDELDAHLRADPPDGVFVGLHDNDAAAEQPFIAFAAAAEYVPLEAREDATLWVPALARWGDAIQLGAVDLPAEAVAPGSTVNATFSIAALRPIEQNLNVLVRVVERSGRELARSEGWPWGRPTSGWAPGEVWPDGHQLALPADAQPGPARVELDFYDPATLEHLGETAIAGFITVADSATQRNAAAGAAPIATFGAEFALLDAHVPQDGWLPGGEQAINFVWRAEGPRRGRYTVFAHLIGPDGKLAAQADQEPLGGFYPTDRWTPGLPVADSAVLRLPESLPGGVYTLRAGFYDPGSGARLPATADGAPAGDSVVQAEVQVQ